MKSLVLQAQRRQTNPKKISIDYVPSKFIIPLDSILDVNRGIHTTVILGFTKCGKYLIGYSLLDLCIISFWNFNFFHPLTLFCEIQLHNITLDRDHWHYHLTESPDSKFYLVYLYNETDLNCLFLIPSPIMYPTCTISSPMFQYVTMERISFIPISSLLVDGSRYAICIPTVSIIQIVTFEMEKSESSADQTESTYDPFEKHLLVKGISPQMNFYREISLDRKTETQKSPLIINTWYFDVEKYLYEHVITTSYDFRIVQQSGNQDVVIVTKCKVDQVDYTFYCILCAFKGELYTIQVKRESLHPKAISTNLNRQFPPKTNIHFMSNESMFCGKGGPAKSLQYLKSPSLPLVISAKK
jgi:hypothetical protein